MKKQSLLIVLLTLTLSGCFYGPGGGYRYRGGEHSDRGGERHGERDARNGWMR